jgi:hypothetical protein
MNDKSHDKLPDFPYTKIRSEQHRPIYKLQFNQEAINSQPQNQQQLANHNSQEKNNGK